MTINSKDLLIYFLLVLGGSAIGFLVGGYTGSNFGMSIIANGTLNKDAKDVRTHIEVLRNLRNGNTATAIESIEAYIDDALIIFDPQEPYPGLQDDTVSAMNNAIKSTWEYRLEFPRRSSRSHVDTMLENLFDRHGFANQ